MWNNGCPEAEHTELEQKLDAALARIKELRVSLAETAGALHSRHDHAIESPKDCPMESCKKAEAVLRKNDYV
jgi:hypothetical protein